MLWLKVWTGSIRFKSIVGASHYRIIADLEDVSFIDSTL